jgi:hypothetical protein
MLTLFSLSRVQAFLLHLAISICFALLSASLVFFIWYPGVFAYASNVVNIFLILLVVDGVIGPLLTLIVFDKKKKELKRDLSIIGLIQIIALSYGLYTMFIARPVYVVFNSNRFDMVFANEINQKRLDKVVSEEYQKLPMFGPKIIAARMPDDPKIAEEIVSSAMSGNGDDLQYRPEHYVTYESQLKDVIAHAKPLDTLAQFNEPKKNDLELINAKYKKLKRNVGYLALSGKDKYLIVVVDKAQGDVLEISKLKPWP